MTRWINKAEVLRRIARLAPAIKEKIKEGLAESADELVAAQKKAAPKRTGKLAEAIIWEWGAIGRANSNPEFTITVHIAAGPQRRIGPLVEFGVAPHINEGIYAGTQNPGFPAEPFFYPIYRAYKKRIKSRARRAVRDGINASKQGS